MKTKLSIPKELLRSNLVDMSIILHDANIEHFIQGGTLIGLVRDGDIIEGDDDIDFFVDISEQYKFINVLRNSKYDITYNDFSNVPLTYMRCFIIENNTRVKIDFSFYDNFYDLDYLIDRSSYKKQIGHMPKDIIFPIVQKEFFGTKISFPYRGDLLCDFQYDSQWKTKLSKDEYLYLNINHKPKVIILNNDK